MLGAGIGNPAIGFLITRHDRPTLLVYIAADLPSILSLHLFELLGSLRVLIKLRDTNRSQALGDSSCSGLLSHRLGTTTGHPATPVESDNGQRYCASDRAQQTEFGFLPIHRGTSFNAGLETREFNSRQQWQ